MPTLLKKNQRILIISKNGFVSLQKISSLCSQTTQTLYTPYNIWHAQGIYTTRLA